MGDLQGMKSEWKRGLAEAPGRVNLIGDHTDYNGLPVFPMALQRRIRMRFQARQDGRVRLASADGYPDREFTIGREIEPYPAGDWGNYVKASARILERTYGNLHGMDAETEGDIPPAAGLSSSSALLVASALALLAVNGIDAGFEKLMELLPEAEYYVGTRGGAMDHAVCLGGQAGMALKIDFTPLRVHPTPVPRDWCFLVAHSLVRAEKSSVVKEQFNSRRAACRRALQQLAPGLSYSDLLRRNTTEELLAEARAMMPEEDARYFRHVITEAARVEQAQQAMRAGDLEQFGKLMTASHASLRDDFKTSHPSVDALVEALLAAGAAGARVTGAGFGGCVVALCRAGEKERVLRGVEAGFYAARPERRDFGEYLIEALASQGARVIALDSDSL
jgi:galactokinase